MTEYGGGGGGWICLWRDLIDKPIWVNGTPEQNRILITLLCMANHKPKKWEFGGELYEVQAGQFITSLPTIAEKCRCHAVTVRKVRTALERFEKLGFLTSKSTNKNRLITIVNWRFYQNQNTEFDRQNVRQLTGECQADVRQLTANNNINNDNKVNNDNNIMSDKPTVISKSKKFIPPSFEQVQAYCHERNNNIDPQAFIDYYSAVGWKVGSKAMKDWKAAIRTWERRSNQQGGQTQNDGHKNTCTGNNEEDRGKQESQFGVTLG